MSTRDRQYFRVAMDAIDRFNRADDETTLRDRLIGAVAAFGYQHVCSISATGNGRTSFIDKVLLNGWPTGWFEQYRNSNFYAHDPVAGLAKMQPRTFKWSDVQLPVNDPLAQSVMTIASSDYKMRHGLCVPIYSLTGYQASISFAGTDVEDVSEAYSAVEMIGIYAFNRLAHLKTRRRPAALLTTREREVLSWTAEGKTAWDTGAILNIAEDTVNKHIASAMRKLNVHTRTQAIVESIRRGEIAL